MYAKYFDHMTKMAATPIYGKTFKNLLRNQEVDDLWTRYVALWMLGLPSLLRRWFYVDLDLFNIKVKFAS